MQDFPERTDLEDGTSWSARFKGHDWAHYGNFYFVFTIYRQAEIAKQFLVEVDDLKYGDPTLDYSREENVQKVRQGLHRLAQKGEANTYALLP
jgi:hypothetical protein